MPSNLELVEQARTYLGVKWRHQGRNRMGVDCVGLVLCCLADLGVEAPDMQGYRRTPDPIFVQHIRENTDPTMEKPLGSIAIFRDGNQPCHVGIFGEKYGQLSIIHAYAGTGIVMEEPFIHHWPSLLIEARTFKGIDYI